jgi:hypothetical protein
VNDPEVERAARLLAWADPDGDEDDPECEWCGVVVPDGASAYAPYCCLDCRREAEEHDRWAGRKEETGDGR